MAENLAALETFVQERMGEGKLAGVSLALVKNGDVVYQRGFGLRDVERGLPATPQTLYGIGSVTKSFTCLSLLQLQEQGLLSVDDPVDRYLGLEVRPFGEPIRLRHLMSHSSGIPGLAYAEAVLGHHQGSGAPYLAIGSTEDMLTFLNGAADWVQARPGERWFYLNEGYVLLGAIVERVSGMPYAQYVQERILDPLGMERTFFSRERLQAEDDRAVPYRTDREGHYLAKEYTFGRVTADGGIISSVEDLARYLAMFLAGGRGPSGEIVGPDSLCAMMTPAVAVPGDDVETGEPASRYCWGLSTSDFLGRRFYGHGGSVGIATAQLSFLPEEGLGAIALANGGGYPVGAFASFALASLLGEDPWQLPMLRSERALKDLTGHYETYRGTMRVTVTRQGDFLNLVFKDNYGERAVPLAPLDLGALRFYTLSGGRRVVAEFQQREGAVELLYERYKLRRVGRL